MIRGKIGIGGTLAWGRRRLPAPLTCLALLLALLALPATPAWAADSDGDGVDDSVDTCRLLPGIASTGGCTPEEYDVSEWSDFNGDGHSDIAGFYDNGSASTTAWVFRGQGAGVANPFATWTGPANTWQLTFSRTVSGDFTGDGLSDVIAFYDYGGVTVSAFLFRGTSAGLSAPTEVWRSAPNSWRMAYARLVAGDFNGDGRSDVVAMYDFSGGSTEAWLFTGSPNGINAPASIWKSAPGAWNLSRSRLLSGDFQGDGYADIVGFYDYGGGTTAAWMFRGSSTGLNTSEVWRSAAGGFELGSARLAAGDFDANGRTDIIAMRDYGNAQAKAFVWYGRGSLLEAPVQTWDSGPGKWGMSAARLISGDFNRDGFADVAAFYDYGGGATAEHLFRGSPSGLSGYLADNWHSRMLGSWTMSSARLVGGARQPRVPSAPPAPTTAPGDTTVDLQWKAASSPGYPITTYRVMATPGGNTCTTNGLSCRVEGLQNATAYTFKVQAVNAVGPSPWSPSSIAATPLPTPSPEQPVTEPEVPPLCVLAKRKAKAGSKVTVKCLHLTSAKLKATLMKKVKKSKKKRAPKVTRTVTIKESTGKLSLRKVRPGTYRVRFAIKGRPGVIGTARLKVKR